MVSKYPSDFGLSTGRVWNATRNFVSCSNAMYQLGFFDGEVKSNLPFLQRAKTVFLLAAATVTFKQLI